MASESTPLVRLAAADPNDDASSRVMSTTTSSLSKKLWWGVVVVLLVGLAFFAGTRVPSTDNNDSSVRAKQINEYADNHDSLLDAAALSNDDEDDAPRYVATQFISFTINTIGGIADKDECEGRPVDPNNGFCYLGNSNNITEDTYHRMAIVEAVLARIQRDASVDRPDIDHDDNILKIVMIPEFFWRGPHGAYSTDLMVPPQTMLADLSDHIRELISGEFWNDFLFVFGTIIAADTPGDPREPWEMDSAQDIVYYNWAAVQKGGPTHRHRYLVSKQYVSTADFLSRTTLPNPREKYENTATYGKIDGELQDVFEGRNITLITDNVLEMDGLRIGLEICLDHNKGTLWNHIQTEDLPLVDILLITSAGMSIERGPNPVVPGGVVYLCDGEASSAACMRTDNDEFQPDTVCRGDIGGLKHIPLGGPG